MGSLDLERFAWKRSIRADPTSDHLARAGHAANPTGGYTLCGLKLPDGDEVTWLIQGTHLCRRCRKSANRQVLTIPPRRERWSGELSARLRRFKNL